MGYRIAGLIVLLSLAAGPGAGQAKYTAPRTADGRPDLSGFWQALNTAAVNLEPHTAILDMPAGLGVIVDPPDGEIPYQPWAAEKQKENFKNRAKADPVNSCYLAGVPRVMYMPFPIQILQTPKYLIMASEYVHTVRNIFMQGQHLDGIDFWMGDSRGHWDGETLVVDVADNNGETWFDRSGNFHSDALHVTERFTRTEPDIITYDATIEDPKVFTKPWRISMPLYRHREPNFKLLEYECNTYLEDAAKEAK
ncbi:MAG: hypothetical protein ACRD5L_02415 [Bryobacteraceae bacterium]